MWTVHKQLANYWYIHSNVRELTESEKTEFKLCMDANMHKVQKLADLENYSLIASMIDDTDWQLDLCRQVDELKDDMYT